MEKFKIRSKISMLDAIATLLPIFLFGQLSLFTPLAILSIAAYWTHSLFTLSIKHIDMSKESYFNYLLLCFTQTYLMIQHPVLLFAHSATSFTRKLTNNFDSDFIFKQLLQTYTNTHKFAKIHFLKLIYYLSIDLILMILIAPYIPIQAVQFSKNHLHLGILASRLSQYTVRIAKSTYSEYKSLLKMEEEAKHAEVISVQASSPRPV